MKYLIIMLLKKYYFKLLCFFTSFFLLITIFAGEDASAAGTGNISFSPSDVNFTPGGNASVDLVWGGDEVAAGEIYLNFSSDITINSFVPGSSKVSFLDVSTSQGELAFGSLDEAILDGESIATITLEISSGCSGSGTMSIDSDKTYIPEFDATYGSLNYSCSASATTGTPTPTSTPTAPPTTTSYPSNTPVQTGTVTVPPPPPTSGPIQTFTPVTTLPKTAVLAGTTSNIIFAVVLLIGGIGTTFYRSIARSKGDNSDVYYK